MTWKVSTCPSSFSVVIQCSVLIKNNEVVSTKVASIFVTKWLYAIAIRWLDFSAVQCTSVRYDDSEIEDKVIREKVLSRSLNYVK